MTKFISRPVLCGPDTVSVLSFSNNLLASGFENGRLCICSPNKSNSHMYFNNSSAPCTALTFNDSSSNILYSAHETQIKSWDIRMVNNLINSWEVTTDEINYIDSLESEHCFATADENGAVNIIFTDPGVVSKSLNSHQNICSAVKFRRNHTDEIVSAGLDCRLVVSNWKCSEKSTTVFKMDALVDSSVYTNMLNSDSEESQYEEYDSHSDVDEDELNEHESPKDLPKETFSSDTSPPSTVDATNKHSNLIEDAIEVDENEFPTSKCHQASVRVASSFTSSECRQFAASRHAGSGLPLNPPMAHSIACTSTGDYFCVGLENGAVEIFNGKAKYLNHVESLCGHSRGVAALLVIQDTFLVSGGNDCNLFVWELVSGGSGQQVAHSGKISALAGQSMSEVFLADSSSIVQVVDLSRF